MNNSGSSTHKARAIPPPNFRNQATGIGQTRGASAATGAMRAMEVVEHMPPHCRRAVPRAEGYVTDGVPFEGRAEDSGFEDSGY